jgi:hypothetical protein
MTVTGAWFAAETEWLRDQFEADRLTAELGCEITMHPRFAAPRVRRCGAGGTAARRRR